MYTTLLSVAVFATCIALAAPAASRDFKYPFICDLDGAAPCTTDHTRNVEAEIRGLGRSGRFATGCGYPNVAVFALNQFCQNGYREPQPRRSGSSCVVA
jgi:hypothetical protein